MRLFNLKTIRSIFTFWFFQNYKPTYLIFFTTNKCEARCGHCFYWKETNQNISELSVSEITRLARKLGPMVQITITGGSPELRTDLYDILRAFIRYCSPINITLCSNGNYPEILFNTAQKVLTDFKNLNLTIDISLDGLNGNHDSIRGINGIFSNVIHSYSLLAELKKDFPGLRLGCGLVVSGLNKESAVETAKWALSNLPLDNFTPVLVRGEPRNKEALNVEPEVFKEISDAVETMLINKSLKGYSGFSKIVNSKDIIQKQLIYKIYRNQKPVIRCSALKETAVIYPEGTVRLCELREESPGNLRDYDMNLSRLWRSRVAGKIRKQLRKDACFCWHQCFLSAAIVKSPVMWYELSKTLTEL